jgi:DNA primase
LEFVLKRDFSETIETVRQSVNIVEIISRHLALKKAGKNYRALCPFHQEKTPSFMVNDDKQIFHCFGCGAGGDVFTFLMRYENLSFYDALTELARIAGVTIPKEGRRPEEEKKRDLLFHINQMAADYFHETLVKKRVGEAGRHYLAHRGIRRKTVETYRLGYAPPGWTNLVNHLGSKSIDLRAAQTVGLIIPRKREGWYDQFRNRIIFPIINTSGRTVGFGGGAIDDSSPKYLNSIESEVYKKSQSIYGIEAASQEIRRRDLALIVEGYFDLLTLHQNGFRHTVAPLGTALTESQVRIMKRYTRNFVIVFDPDEPGIKATFRAFEPFAAEEIHPKTVMLPPGQDPDSFVKKAGAEAFERVIEMAVPLVDAFIERSMRKGDMKTVGGKTEIGRAILPILRKLRDPLERTLYARSVSEKLGLNEEDLLPLLEEAKARSRTKRPREVETPRSDVFPAFEEALVEVMLKHPRFIPVILEKGVIQDFESDALRHLAAILKEDLDRNGHISVNRVLSRLSDEALKSRVSFWALSERFREEDLQKAVADCIGKIKRNRLRRDQDIITQRIKEAEKTGQTSLLQELLRQKQHLTEEERTLAKTDHLA